MRSRLTARCSSIAAVVITLGATFLASVQPALAQTPGEIKTQAKISSTQGGFVGALGNDDRFGIACTGIGDLDGDGNPDIAVCAYQDDDGGSNKGALYILFLNADRTVKSFYKNSELSGDISALPSPGEFGFSITSLGDVDGDGLTDLAVGSLRAGTDDGGQLHILRMNSDGSVKSELLITEGVAGFGGDLDTFDLFGGSVDVVGDLDGDGIDDLAVGAYRDVDGGAFSTGAVYILFLNGDQTVKAWQKISQTEGGLGLTLEDSAEFGAEVAGIGDLDGDGVPDLAVGAPLKLASPGRGAVYILFLNTDGTVKSSHLMDNFGDLAGVYGSGGFSDFGFAIARAGDLDGDGIDDIFVGAAQENEVHAIKLAADGTGTAIAKIGANTGGFVGSFLGTDRFGKGLRPVGDLDGDGVQDLVVGSWFDSDGGSGRGAVYLLEVVGPPTPAAVPSFVSSLDGRAGRSTLIKPGGGGDEAILVPAVIVPNQSASCVSVREVVVVGEEVAFGAKYIEETGEFPLHAVQGGIIATQEGDGGGLADIFTANNGGDSFSYLAGQDIVGQPPFAPQVEFAMPNDGAPVAIALGDFDADLATDVVLAGDAGVTIFLGDGLGGFTAAGFAPVALLSDLAVGFVDGDTHLDVVTTSAALALGPGSEQGFATVLLGDGAGNLAAGGTFATGQALASILLSDIDNDSDLDAMLAVHQFDAGPGGAPQGTLALHLGDGLGGFTPSGIFAGLATPSADGVHPTFGAVGDLNNDTFDDFVYTSAENIAFAPGTFSDEHPPIALTVLLNDQAGGFTPSIVGTPYAGKGVAPVLDDIAPAPLDGVLDCTLVWYEDTLAGQGAGTQLASFVAVLLGDGTGDFFDPSPNQFLTGNEPGDGDIGDVNGDAPGDGGGGGPDVLIPNTKGDSVSVLLSDGAGGVETVITVNDVDAQDPGTLPPGGVWEGGPRALQVADLGGDTDLDAVVYNAWVDTANLFSQVFASLSVLQGDGTGNMLVAQSVPLGRGGEMAVGDVTGDGTDDVVVTQRLGSGGLDQVLVFPGTGTGAGAIAGSPTPAPVPPGHVLSGGLVLVDIVGDAGLDAVTTSTEGGDGRVLVYENVAGALVPTPHDAGATWNTVRSIDVADLTGDGDDDVAVGVANGRLVLVAASGSGFVPSPVSAQAAAVGGGALRIGNLDGDGRPDIISSGSVADGTLDQAFVRRLIGTGPGAFGVDTLGGLAANGADGNALRPLVGDLDGDGTSDLVLIHGTADSVSLVLNELHETEAFGTGKPGKGGLTPQLRGSGYTTPGGFMDVRLTNGVGGAAGLLQVGVGRIETGFLHVAAPLLDLFPVVGGAPGVAGQGELTLPFKLPTDAILVGESFTLQWFLVDPDAGGPMPTMISASNGLEVTIVD